MTKIGERKKMICKSTGEPVLMEFVGEGETGRYNGHKGWLCLHKSDFE